MRTLLALLGLFTGCTPAMHLTYPGTGTWDGSIQMLGPVVACDGGGCCGTDEGCKWPLSLVNPPEAYTYQAALREQAVKKYGVSPGDLVIGDIAVTVDTELVGTVRGWKATATAGRRAAPTPAASVSREERLRELESLHQQGLLSDAEYRTRRAGILEGL